MAAALAAIGIGGAFSASTLGTIASLASTGYQIYKSTQTPDEIELPDLPKPISPGIRDRERETRGREEERAKRRRGRASTIATSPLGLPKANVQKKSLLGT
jgi:hypothetical protein